jgi:hypothetical protein
MMRLCPIKYGIKSGSGLADPYSSYVVFLLHFDGADGSKVYTDETGKTWSGSSTEYIVTDEKKFGTGSLYSSGGAFNPTRISCGDPYFSTNAIGTQDFCLEIFAWIGPSYSLVGNRAICGFISTQYAFCLAHNQDAGTNGRFQGSIGDSGALSIYGNTTYPNKEQWYHVAMTRDGNTLRLFVDGISQGSSDVTGLSIEAEDNFYIGDLQTISPTDQYIPFLGRLDEARLTVGVPRYTADFDPPTEAFIYP